MTSSTFRQFLPNGRTRLLGILGDPIDHSLSPELHTAVLRKLDRNMLYVPVPVSKGRLRAFLGLAAEQGFRGCNVTTPYKEQVPRAAEPRDGDTQDGHGEYVDVRCAGPETGRGRNGRPGDPGLAR
ncbi:MAG: hypothetical protein R3E97_21370 [Candidatus Eisenbacteria bacterium]